MLVSVFDDDITFDSMFVLLWMVFKSSTSEKTRQLFENLTEFDDLFIAFYFGGWKGLTSIDIFSSTVDALQAKIKTTKESNGIIWRWYWQFHSKCFAIRLGWIVHLNFIQIFKIYTYHSQSSLGPFAEKYIRLHHGPFSPSFLHYTWPGIFPRDILKFSLIR